MLSIQLIREQPDSIRAALKNRHEDTVNLDIVIKNDNIRRSLLVEGESLRAQRNSVSKQLSKMSDKPSEIIEEMRDVGAKIKTYTDVG